MKKIIGTIYSFDWNLIQKKYGIKWWEKILLRFKKSYYGYDYGREHKENYSVVVIAKKMFGKIYIVGEHYCDNLQNPSINQEKKGKV